MNAESPPVRILGIDHGSSRIGLAISDDLGMLAHPLETIALKQTPDPVARIAAIVAQRAVTTVVLGLPLNMDGSEGAATGKVRAFAAALKPALPGVTTIVLVDERLSTVSAQAHLHASGRSVRNSRGVIDQAAACVILQDYLDHQAGSSCLPPPCD